MVAMVGVVGVAFWTVIATIRREERAASEARLAHAGAKEGECKP
jgi:hypothetical protein